MTSEERRKKRRELYNKLSTDLIKAIKSYFDKEKERDVMLHNVFLIVSTIGLDEGCTLPEVLGSIETAKFELCSMVIQPDDYIEENESNNNDSDEQLL